MESPLVEVFQYHLPLARPLDIKGQILTHRSGLILKFGPTEREVGYGDIAPLPGFSPESLDQATKAVMTWSALLGRLPKDAGEREEALGFLRETPSAQFGIECATFNFRHAIGSTRSLGLFSKTRKRVSVNALLTGTRDEVFEKAQRAREEKYRAAKLKVGRQSVQADIGTVRDLGRFLGAVSLRLDANRAWDYDTARTFARGIADCGIEYIEEPLADPSRLRELAEETGLPIALDETLAEQTAADDWIKDYQWAKAVVLKPTRLGGVQRCKRLAYEALEFGLKPVVSSCFESGLGLIALAHFAATVTTEDIPVGLDTYEWLAEDVLDRRFTVREGALDLDELDKCAATVKLDSLQRVYRD